MDLTKENLFKLIIEENKSYSEIGRMFGITGNAIKKKARLLGISLHRRRKINPKENFSHPQKDIQRNLKKRKIILCI